MVTKKYGGLVLISPQGVVPYEISHTNRMMPMTRPIISAQKTPYMGRRLESN